MTIKTILVAVSGGTASLGAAELACRLAKRYEAHLEGFHVRIDPREIAANMADGGFGSGMPMAGELMDRIAADAADLANKTKAAFLAAIAHQGIPLAVAPAAAAVSASAAWRDEIGYAPQLVSRRARFFDLVILGRSDRVVERPHSDTIDETLLHSGRPVLLASAQAPAAIGDAIAVGWNGSIEAVKALAVSLPLLAAAKTVSVVTIGDKEKDTVGPVMEYLTWHGISATHRHGQDNGAGWGQQLLTVAQDSAADLLVMGGYGHPRWREFLFGGATREVVAASSLPVLLSH